jgi:hypothetical protein
LNSNDYKEKPKQKRFSQNSRIPSLKSQIVFPPFLKETLKPGAKALGKKKLSHIMDLKLKKGMTKYKL